MAHRLFWFCQEDRLHLYTIEERAGELDFDTINHMYYSRRENHLVPFIPPYLQNLEFTVEQLKKIMKESVPRKYYKGDYYIVIPDDFIEIECRALEEIAEECGARKNRAEYLCLLLSTDPKYLTVTRGVNSVVVSRVDYEQQEFHPIYLKFPCEPIMIQQALDTLDANKELPVYTYGIPESQDGNDFGTPISDEDIMINYLYY